MNARPRKRGPCRSTETATKANRVLATIVAIGVEMYEKEDDDDDNGNDEGECLVRDVREMPLECSKATCISIF